LKLVTITLKTLEKERDLAQAGSFYFSSKFFSGAERMTGLLFSLLTGREYTS